MTINLKIPDIHEMKPRITVFGVGGAGGNAVNYMITAGLQGVDFVVADADAPALAPSLKLAARPPKKRWTRYAIISPARIWCSSRQAWAAAPGPALRRSSP